MTENQKREIEFQKQLKEDARERAKRAHQRLENGKKYLMGTRPELITIEDILIAFGFSRNILEGE
jgi:uncharacterized membrane protein (DUF106 family)